MAVLYTQHFAQFFDSNGDPLNGGKLYTYDAGTITPKETYTDEGGGTPNANPVVLDSAGRATIFLSGSYKFRLETSSGLLIEETDNVTAFATGESGVDSITTSFTEAVVAADDSFIFADASDSNTTRRDTIQGILDLNLSGWSPIKTVTVNNDSSIDFVNGSGGVVFDGTYKAYVVVFSIIPTTDNTDLRMRLSTNAGSSYDAGASDYKYAAIGLDSTTGTVSFNSGGATFLLLGDGVGNGAAEGISGTVYIFDPGNAALKTRILTNVSLYRAADTSRSYLGGGYRDAAQDTDAIRFLMSSGNITSGTFTLYGLRSAS